MTSVNAESTPDDSGGDSAAGPVTAATDRVLATAAGLDEAALRGPSLCAPWTRAHVLTHLARNADALVNLLTWARTGTETFAYPSAESRAADIEAGAARPPGELVEDLYTSAERFTKAVMDMPDHGWERRVHPRAGGEGDPVPGRRVLWLRLLELELHHVDLDAGYTPADWPDSFVRRALDDTVRAFGRRDDVPAVAVAVDGRPTEHLGTETRVTVAGPARPMLGWLTGRGGGAELTVDPSDARLPVLPPWS
ncbi:maleylpyruvate isomerase [Haloactinopolyspora alba]|uniref:Maleylpyruvate isomerase n=1 Tax=Haloactinopolyspora alba TaxID=648780 RepID=A0A2P8E3Q8_9ACTN|nr:maleylpyruvate isomerase family mycothiol-dependent enzyme [Haloactinopolyspora alba]PSL04057.1 maleylpyruvate isomerase [Haloactinopolyspora alba]